MTPSLENTVTDWREVLPIVKPFYERFFGEEMQWGDITLYVMPLDEETGGQLNLESGDICINSNIPIENVPKTFVHELAHKKYEEATGIGMTYAKKTVTRIPFLRAHYRKKHSLNLFLHECIAKTVEFLFSEEDVILDCKRLDGSTTKSIRYTSLDIACSDIEFTEIYGFHYKRLPGQLTARALFIGKYLATKYENDPNLWSKLKQLRTLDDLKELVEGEWP